ncbi:MAG: histidine phosphatase family protein, partial [Kiritimatiellaeota bacterium]|nr:histidine phosphatase family protein [Kiritimatiellota bacterium]
MSEKTRVVITGLGAITPVGNDAATLWQNIQNGVCGVGPITKFDGSRLEVKAVAEVKGFNPADYMDAKDARRMALFTQYSVAAAKQAWRDANLALDAIDTFRASVVLGVGIGGKEVDEEAYRVLFEKGPSRLSPMVIPKIIANEACGNISMGLGVQGLAMAVATACASGADALGVALDMIRAGRADIVIAGGAESTITEYSLGGFQAMRALSTNPDFQTACRPFDKERDGFVMGEGAAVLILESEASAKARGAKIYAELAGYGDQVQLDENLAEFDYGAYEGLTTPDIIAQRGLSWNLWRNGVPADSPGVDVQKRAKRVIARALETMWQGEDVIAFAHGHFLRAMAA